MNKSNNNKVPYNKYLLVLLTISICLNIFFYNNKLKQTEDIQAKNDYLRYIIVLKLDRQSDIFNKLSKYSRQISNDSLAIEKIDLYVSGIKEFLQNDIIYGLNELVFDNNAEIKNILKRISEVILNINTELRNTPPDEFELLAENFNKVSSLISRTNKEDSLTYYILKNDISNPNFKNVLDEVDARLLEIENILY